MTFDLTQFGVPSGDAGGPNAAMIFGALALLFDLLFTLIVVKEASERGANPLAWGALTLFVPLIGYLIWKASTSQEDHPADMSLITRELRRPRRTPTAPTPPVQQRPPEQPRSPRRRPRMFF